MQNNKLMKCVNCGNTEFFQTEIGIILSTHGQFNVNAYACQNCGHIELFDPKLDSFGSQMRIENGARQRREEAERSKKGKQQQDIKDL